MHGRIVEFRSRSCHTLSTFSDFRELVGTLATYESIFAFLRLHGSGTPFGDALELEGLGMALRELGYYSYSTERRRCVVGSNKGNLGNTQVRLSLSLFIFLSGLQHNSRLIIFQFSTHLA